MKTNRRIRERRQWKPDFATLLRAVRFHGRGYLRGRDTDEMKRACDEADADYFRR